MRILQIIPGKIWGGAEQYIVDLAKALEARGHRVSFIAHDREPVTCQLARRGIEYRTLPFSWSLDRKSIMALTEILRNEDYDVVHVHSAMFVPIAELAKARAGSNSKVVMTRHEAHRTRVNVLLRPLFRRLHRIIFVSNLVQRRWRGANSWITDGMCRVIHNSIPPYEPKEVESLRDKYHILAGEPLIMYAGRVKKSKGCSVILHALSRISDKKFHIVFIGALKSDKYHRQLMDIAAQGGIANRVHFYGFTPDARHFMPQADIAVAPSVTLDSCPLTNIEYLKAGVCEVSTNNGGQAEYLEDGHTALLVDPGDDIGLAEAIARVIDDKCLRLRLAAAGKEHFERDMSYDRFIDKVIEAYN